VTEPEDLPDQTTNHDDDISDDLHLFTVETAAEMIQRAAYTADEPGPPLCTLLECVMATVIAEEFKPDGQSWILDQIVEGVRYRLFGEDVEHPVAGSC
jgi:hypothetical protein